MKKIISYFAFWNEFFTNTKLMYHLRKIKIQNDKRTLIQFALRNYIARFAQSISKYYLFVILDF
jgi:hypothetical protein